MKFHSTTSIQLTKEQQNRNIWLTIIIGLIIVFVAQGISILPGTYIKNTGVQEVYNLFANLFVILIVILFCKFFQKRTLSSLGFKDKHIISKIFTGIILSITFLMTVLLVNLLAGSVELTSNLTAVNLVYVLAAFLAYFPQGLMEEIVCRGFIMNSLSAKYNVWIGLIVNSLIFAILHGINPDTTPLALFNLFLAGMLLSTIFCLTDNILFVGAFHAVWNFMLGPVFGVKVSGLSVYSSLFKTTLLPEQSLINGGNFGFEGGLGLTISIFIAFTIIFLFIKIRDKQTKN